MSDYEFHQYPSSKHQDDPYVPGPKLAIAVNTALAAEQPLLVTGEPGTGKTQLAASVARHLGRGEVLTFVARSDHQARDCLYTFDSLRRLYDAQINDGRARHPGAYVRLGALGQAIASDVPRVVLIDEIDKAPRDFPNDLLGVLEDRLEVVVQETGATITAAPGVRPLVIVTSNQEQQLPAPFLRRCVFHHIAFPTNDQLAAIVRRRFAPATISDGLILAAVKRFMEVRAMEPEKPPATGELLTWVRVLLRARVSETEIPKAPLSELYPGALLKLEHDLKRLAPAEETKPAGS